MFLALLQSTFATFCDKAAFAEFSSYERKQMYKENQTNTNDHITPAQAKKSISKMNLINGFLFDSALEHEDEAKIIVGNILKAVFYRKFTVQSVTSQKPLQSIDTNYHGIRLDVLITEDDDGNNPTATVYDMEMVSEAFSYTATESPILTPQTAGAGSTNSQNIAKCFRKC